MAGGFIDTGSRLVMACIDRAEGNPLFLEQLLRNAEEQGGENIPASIQSPMLARIGRLAAEPLPWRRFVVARGRALATHGRGKRDAATLAEIAELRGEAMRVGLRIALPALEAALAESASEPPK